MYTKKEYPGLPSNIGKKVTVRSIDNKYEHWKVRDEIREPWYRRKIITLQRLESKGKKQKLRLGYYVVSEKSGGKNEWKWVPGQLCTMMPKATFKQILNKATEKGWL